MKNILSHKTIYFVIVASIIAFSITKCVEPFEPEIDNYENLVVVDGFLSNEAVQYWVRLSRSIDFADQRVNYISDALVKIIDNDGNEYIMTEEKFPQGRYVINPGSGFTGQIGKKYQLYMKIDDKEYASNFELMMKAPEIDSVYYTTYEEVVKSQYSGNIKVQGVEMLIDTKADENTAQHVFWQYDETWKFRVPYTKPGIDNKKTCYDSKTSTTFLFADLREYKNKTLTANSLYKVDNQSNKLKLTYSSNIKQYGVSEEVYQFYKKQKDQQDNGGSLFDKTPITITGNIKCITNPDEPVLGIFRIASASTKRIFIKNSEIKDRVNVYEDVENCQSSTFSIEENANEIAQSMKEGMIVLDTIEINKVLYVRLVSTPLCYDCTYGGATTSVPSFWIKDDDE